MGQIFALVAFSAGVFAPVVFVDLPETTSVLILLLLSAVGCSVVFRYFRAALCLVLTGFLIGLSFGCYSAQQFGQSILPHELNNHRVLMSGYIQGIPLKQGPVWRLNFIPETLEPVDGQKADLDFKGYVPDKVRLSFYTHPEQAFVSGESLTLEARLQRPHGLMNKGLFDYQRWLIGEGYSATGYIKKLVHRSDSIKSSAKVDQWRAQLSQKISQSNVPHPGIQTALLNGDRSAISPSHMNLFVETGTIHLMVISGLHIGFVAAIGFFFSRWLLSSLVFARGSPSAHLNAVRCACLGAVIMAGLYALAAGLSTPTVRALIMLAALMLPRFFYLKTSHWWGLSLALAIIAVIDPLAPLQNGFWLSFAAVALIFVSLNKREDFQQPEGVKPGPVLKPLWSLVRIQLIFLIGFSPLILMVQGKINLVSFFANVVAVPITGLLVVPLEILGLVIFQLHTESGIQIWELAGRIIGFEICYLELLQKTFRWTLLRNSIPLYLELLSVLAGILLFGFNRAGHRLLALLCMSPAFLPLNLISQDDFALEVRVFDVGQGLSILVRQPGYQLLYDTGPRFSESFDSGRDILAPSLAQMGIPELEDLIISHPDADHMGGYKGLANEVHVENIWVGRQHESEPVPDAMACVRGRSWSYKAVRYEFIYPFMPDNDGSGSDYQSDNDRSCVLKISWADQIILIPGDISASVEKQLLSEFSGGHNVSLLIAAHHGSKTSSSIRFLDKTRPQRVVFSSGYLNRFGHPHPEVVARYQKRGSTTYATSKDGMISFRWQAPNALPLVEKEAEKRIFWWQK